MTINKSAKDYISKNIKDLEDIQTNFSNYNLENNNILNFQNITINLKHQIRLYERDVTNSIIFGNSNTKIGNSKNEIGDNRKEWVLLEEKNNFLTFEARDNVADVMRNQQNIAKNGIFGSGDSEKTRETENLETEQKENTWTTKIEEENILLGGILNSVENIEISEVGVENDTEKLISTMNTDQTYDSDEKEYKIETEIQIEFSGQGTFTDFFKNLMNISLLKKENLGIVYTGFPRENINRRIVVGDSDHQVADDDDLINASKNDVIFKNNSVEDQDQGVRIISQLSSIEPDKNHNFEISEVGLYDENKELLWSNQFNPITKTDTTQIVALFNIDVRESLQNL